MYKIRVKQLLMLLVGLPVNRSWGFGESKVNRGFSIARGSTPQTPVLFKGQLYL